MAAAEAALVGRRRRNEGRVPSRRPTIGCSTTRASETRVSFLNWQDYIDPTILTDFKAATGLAVGYETYESNDALLARLNQAAVTRKGGRAATSFDLIVPGSWDVFLDSAYTGRMSLLNERRDAFAAALLQLGEDPNTTDPATIAKAESVLAATKSNAVQLGHLPQRVG